MALICLPALSNSILTLPVPVRVCCVYVGSTLHVSLQPPEQHWASCLATVLHGDSDPAISRVTSQWLDCDKIQWARDQNTLGVYFPCGNSLISTYVSSPALKSARICSEVCRLEMSLREKTTHIIFRKSATCLGMKGVLNVVMATVKWWSIVVCVCVCRWRSEAKHCSVTHSS